MKAHTIFSLFAIAFVILCIFVMLNGCNSDIENLNYQFKEGEFVKVKMTGEKGQVISTYPLSQIRHQARCPASARQHIRN